MFFVFFRILVFSTRKIYNPVSFRDNSKTRTCVQAIIKAEIYLLMGNAWD